MRKVTPNIWTQLRADKPALVARVDELLRGQSATYQTIQSLIAEEFGVTLTINDLSKRFRHIGNEDILESARHAVADRIAASAQRAGDAAAAVRESFPSLMERSYQVLAETLLDNSLDPEESRATATLELCNALTAGLRTQIRAKAVEQNQAALDLEREKWEFTAAEAVIAHLDTLRTIQADSNMDADAKLNAVRQRLFGGTPA